jgi:hypothetical protein
VFEDLTELFEVLVQVLLFDGVITFFLGRNFLSTDTAKLDEFGTGRAKRIGPFTWTFGLGNTTSNFIEKIRRRDGANEGGEYVSRKSV